MSVTVAALLAQARTLGVDRLDAQLLVAHQLQRPRSWLLAHDDEALAVADAAALEQALQRRAAGEPLAYLVGEREFRGLRFAVGPAVLVPRPETEHLVDWALECLAGHASPRVIDLGTGSGAIAVSLALQRPDAEVWATDVDAQALAVALANAHRLGATVRGAQGSWWAAAPPGRVDLAVSNPPYIAGDDPHLGALRHEPRHALTPEGDGLDALRALVAGAPTHLAPGAWLLLEHGHDQGEAARELLSRTGFRAVQTRRDLAGHERCSGGLWPATTTPFAV